MIDTLNKENEKAERQIRDLKTETKNLERAKNDEKRKL